MRTAVTIAVTHKGNEVLLAGRTVPIEKQKALFRSLLGGPRIHEKFSEVNLQESDVAHVQTVALEHPDAFTKRERAQAEAAEKTAAAAKAKAEAEVKAKADALAEAQAKFEATAKKHDDAAKAKAQSEQSTH